MKRIVRATAVLMMTLLLGASMAAHAATIYTLTCKGQKSGNIPAITLTGFAFKLANGQQPIVLPSGSKTNFELTFRFSPSATYLTLLNIAGTNENLTQCILSGGGATGGANSAASAGPLWEFDNANLLSVTATGGDVTPNQPLGEVEATLAAQSYKFTSAGKTAMGSGSLR